MKNDQLAQDYYSRCQKRLKALDTLYKESAWADVVREAQEIVELALKALLRSMRIEVPRIHDVSQVLKEKQKTVPAAVKPHLEELCRISHKMRRDRELAFYGSEDLTPSAFYTEVDAKTARQEAKFVVQKLAPVFGG